MKRKRREGESPPPPKKGHAPKSATIGAQQEIGNKILAALDCSQDKFPPSIETVQIWNGKARRLALEFARLGNWENCRALLIHMLGMYLRLGGTMRLKAASLHAPARETTRSLTSNH